MSLVTIPYSSFVLASNDIRPYQVLAGVKAVITGTQAVTKDDVAQECYIMFSHSLNGTETTTLNTYVAAYVPSDVGFS